MWEYNVGWFCAVFPSIQWIIPEFRNTLGISWKYKGGLGELREVVWCCVMLWILNLRLCVVFHVVTIPKNLGMCAGSFCAEQRTITRNPEEQDDMSWGTSSQYRYIMLSVRNWCPSKSREVCLVFRILGSTLKPRFLHPSIVAMYPFGVSIMYYTYIYMLKYLYIYMYTHTYTSNIWKTCVWKLVASTHHAWYPFIWSISMCLAYLPFMFINNLPHVTF